MDSTNISSSSNLEKDIENFAISMKNIGFTQEGVTSILTSMAASSSFLTVAEVYKYMTDLEIQQYEDFTDTEKRDDLQLVELNKYCLKNIGKKIGEVQNEVMHYLLISGVQELQRLIKYAPIFTNLTDEQAQQVGTLISNKDLSGLDKYLNNLVQN